MRRPKDEESPSDQILIPFFVGALIYGQLDKALWIFGLAVLTDAFDGYIARMHSQKTILGILKG